MAVSAIDLFFVTFNCAKNLVESTVFARHLHAALREKADTLPDLVVFSLQEVAPLSSSFIGNWFLNPYVTRFSQSINLAASSFGNELLINQERQDGKSHYSLIKAKNVGYTAILLFAKDPKYLRDIQEAEVGFGAAEMGNKGAVGLRALFEKDQHGSTELTFIAAHLAAMEWNLPRRNANWDTIMKRMTFENPIGLLGSCDRTVDSPAEDDSGEVTHLLQDQYGEHAAELHRKLHEISIFKPTSHLFVGGDLNYRTSATAPPPDAIFPSLDKHSEHYYPSFFALDQLTREKEAGRTLHGLTEHDVNFPPTYKYVVQDDKHTVPGSLQAVSWKFAQHRYPSWTDRILYLEVPDWIDSNITHEHRRMTVHAYDAMPLLRSSDHRPVFLRVEVPLLNPEDMMPPASLKQDNFVQDPRVRLPVEIDLEAWNRRAKARRREVFLGWGMFLWSTKEGACIVATLLVVGFSSYWYYQAS